MGMIGLKQVPVFPVNDQKRPLNRNGHKGAVRHRMIPQGWPLVGVPTGSASGLSVVDVDVPAGTGWYDANFDALPLTQVHETRRGGLHLLYRAVPGLGCTAALHRASISEATAALLCGGRAKVCLGLAAL
jgi:hypothetical protein